MTKHILQSTFVFIIFVLSCKKNNPPTVPKIETTVVSSITNSTAISGGTILSDGGAEITAKGVVWGLSTSPNINSNSKTIDGIGSSSFLSQIKNLSSNTFYYIRSYCKSSA